MAKQTNAAGGDLFIVDNTDEHWKVKNYLRDWTEIAHRFDIATGYFEIIVDLDDALFEKRGERSSDICIFHEKGAETIFHIVEVKRKRHI